MKRSPPHAHFLNRELGFLAFNRRVLAQAADEAVPLLERLRFLCIVSSNLDEFVEIRVAGLKEQIKLNVHEAGPDGKDRYTLAPHERNKLLAAGPYKIRVAGADGLSLDGTHLHPRYVRFLENKLPKDD